MMRTSLDGKENPDSPVDSRSRREYHTAMHDDDQAIARHLPYLRRYARALTGSQESGDRYVVLCLEAMLAEAEQGGPRPQNRVELYRAFHATWDRTGACLGDETLADGTIRQRADTYLQRLSHRKRQALLLTAIDGFSTIETAKILDATEQDIEGLLRLAHADLRRQVATTALIIEDEPIIAVDIAGIITEMGHRVVGTATTRAEAVEMAERMSPGIILADIQLGDGSSGIDAVADILETIDVPVIFVTAYPERLLTGQRKEPTFLVTKPFEPETLKVTVYQALMAAPADLPAELAS